SMLFLNLDCGRRVSLDALDYSCTYASLLEGRPDAQMNASIIERALSARESTWGKRAVHVIPPVIDNSDSAHPKRPPIVLRRWLTCYQPIHPKFMASELVVMWFSQDCHGETMADVVYRAVRGLSWDQLARDFEL